MARSLQALLSASITLLLGSAALHAQTIADYNEFYRLLRFNAVETIAPCYRTESAKSEPVSYGVKRDELGRITQLSRFSFGNPDTKGGWTTMRIEYTEYDTTNTVVQRRTYFNASGMPINIGRAFAEEVISRRGTGQLLLRKLVDRTGKPVDDDAGVSRTLFRSDEPGELQQEWYISTGKLHFGTGSDGLLRPFADMPQETYYRRMKVDDQGNLLREEVWGYDKKPIPFPGGEIVRAYELNECGQPVRVTFLDSEGDRMSDSNGIASMTMAYDAWGRLLEWHTLDRSDDPKGRRGDGLAGAKYIYRAFDGMLMNEETYDEKGNRIYLAR